MSLTDMAISAGIGAIKGVTAEVGKNVGVTDTSSGMDVLRGTLKVLSQVSDGSLVGVTRSARVEPITLIDSTLNGHPSLSHTLQCLQSTVLAYYLQAVAMTATIGDISVAGRLDPLSTSRDPLNSFIVANENYAEALPMYDGSSSVNFALNQALSNVATEAIQNHTQQANQAAAAGSAGNSKDKKNSGKDSVDVERDVGIQDAANLVVGKVVNVTLQHGNSSATVPIAIRLACVYMPESPMAGILSGLGTDYTFRERWAQLRHGGISFWKDFVLCQDIIDEHKKNLTEDKSGIYLSMMQRRADNNAASVSSGGKVSLNNASTLLVVAKETLEQVENKLGIRFDNFNQRQNLFKNGYMMIVAVMDRRWSRVTVYTRGIRETTTVSFADLKTASKGDGPDVGDILSAFRAGTAATL